MKERPITAGAATRGGAEAFGRAQKAHNVSVAGEGKVGYEQRHTEMMERCKHNEIKLRRLAVKGYWERAQVSCGK